MSHRDWIDRTYPHHLKRGHRGAPPSEAFTDRMQGAAAALRMPFNCNWPHDIRAAAKRRRRRIRQQGGQAGF